MNKKLQILSLTGAAALVGAMLPVMPAAAWGPERPTYTNEQPADHAVFNSIKNNAAVGDERDFVRIEEKNSGRPYSSDIYIYPDRDYEVYIYYHNDASQTFNDAAHNYVGVAREVRLSTNFPDSLVKNQSEPVWAKITSTTTDPEAVWDEAYVTAVEDMTLHYELASAKIYNKWGVNGSVLSTAIFSEEGTLLGLNELNGLILGCDVYSGYITYTIHTKSVEKQVDPEPEEPEKPEDPVPTELPETGPAEIFLAVAIVIVVSAGVFYWMKTHNEVKKVTKKAKGKK